MKSEPEVTQSCLTLCDPVDCSPPGSSIHGILQARILEWVGISFSRGSSQTLALCSFVKSPLLCAILMLGYPSFSFEVGANKNWIIKPYSLKCYHLGWILHLLKMCLRSAWPAKPDQPCSLICWKLFIFLMSKSYQSKVLKHNLVKILITLNLSDKVNAITAFSHVRKEEDERRGNL